MKNKKPKKPNPNIKAEDFVTVGLHRQRFYRWMALFLVALLFVGGTLAVNYLLFIPWKNKQWNAANSTKPQLPETFTWTFDTIFAFVLVMVLLVFGIIYTFLYFWFSLRLDYNDPKQKRVVVGAIGYTAGFTDTIGVGSFGITTGLLKVSRSLKDDSKLPGTLNIALGVAALVESALFVGSIKVDPLTLMILLASLIVGVIISSLFVSKIKNAQVVKLVMGITLFIVGILMILTHPQVGVINTSNIGDHDSLMDKPWRIVVGSLIFVVFGAIQAFGVGLYAPAMATLSFLGLDQEVAFPIMACGSAISMLPGSISFIRRRNYLQLTSNLIFIFSIFGVVTSFLLVFVGLQMGVGMDALMFNIVLRWLAVIVIFYVSISMLVEYGLSFRKNGQNKQK